MTLNPASDLQEFLALLHSEGQLATVDAPVDPHLEVAEIHRRVIAQGGPALLFRNIKGAAFPLVTNLFGASRRMELAFGSKPEELVRGIARLPEKLMPPSWGRLWQERRVLLDCAGIGTKSVSDAPVKELFDSPPRLDRLPLLTTWKEDGGPFITLPLVYTQHPGTGTSNLGIYRLQRFDDSTTGFHCQIGKGAGFHLAEARRMGQKLPVNVAIGGPPALLVAAAAPLPENTPELLLASLILGKKTRLARNAAGPLPLLASAEFVLVGEVDPHVTRAEGPFGDHYGYYSLQHDYPVFKCHGAYRRKNAICTATVVGKGRQEDCFLGDYIQDLLAPVFPLIMPSVLGLRAYGETGYHSLATALVKQQRYKREALAAAFRILGEGQLSLTKFLLVIEKPMNLRDFKAVLQHVLERVDWRTDLYVLSNTSMDTLDYTSTRVNEGSKAILLGLGEKCRDLPGQFQGELPQGIKTALAFCPGCLVVDGPAFHDEPRLAERISTASAFTGWQMIVISDNAADSTSSAADFLWHTFTRFDAALDIKARGRVIENNHIAFTAPVVIDARMKPGYPDELECDPDTERLVSSRWKEYFPGQGSTISKK